MHRLLLPMPNWLSEELQNTPLRPLPAKTSTGAASRSLTRTLGAQCIGRRSLSASPCRGKGASRHSRHCSSPPRRRYRSLPYMARNRCPQSQVGRVFASCRTLCTTDAPPLNCSPPCFAQVLNYGQSIFEGLKAYRTEDGGIVIFRPEANAARMAAGAGRMMMPPVSEDMFIQAITDTVIPPSLLSAPSCPSANRHHKGLLLGHIIAPCTQRVSSDMPYVAPPDLLLTQVKANADLVPPVGTGSLYVRPVLMGTGSTLGVKPAPEYTFMVYCAAVGPYFKVLPSLRPSIPHAFAVGFSSSESSPSSSGP